LAYRVLDHSGRVHDADNISHTYDKETDVNSQPSVGGIRLPFGPKPKSSAEPIPRTAEDVKQVMIKEVVNQIATRLGNTTRAVEVQVAGGEPALNQAGEFMERGLWARALEELEKSPALPKAEEEAYRQYDLGLVYEAMAYDAKTADDQRTNFFKAQEYYDKALALHPKEEYFIETVARTRDSIARYRSLDAMKKEDQVAQRAGRSGEASAPAAGKPVGLASAMPEARSASLPPAAEPEAKSLNVADVIEMAQAGVDDEQIILMIHNSDVAFDYLDKDTAIAVARGKLSVRLQNELRKKVGAPLLSAPGAAKPAAAPKPAGPPKPAPATAVPAAAPPLKKSP
jgi:tetratricopeptide (TPR) repeat protein